MASKKGGFTIIEVGLFLAVSGLLTVGVIGAFNTRIKTQRFNDSVQDFAEFLRGVYSDVINVESVTAKYAANGCSDKTSSGKGKGGVSDCVIYGKFVEFKNGKIATYDVIGNDLRPNNTDTTQFFRSSANLRKVDDSRVERNLQWQAVIEGTSYNSKLTAGMLIVRSPVDGVAHTFYRSGSSNFPAASEIGAGGKYEEGQEINFCLNSEDATYKGTKRERRNIRIAKDAHNASAVQLISMNSTGGDGNKCN